MIRKIKNTELKTRKTSKGITLIALVISIIVLLILAGVSIATLTGENGIITQAENAKKETEIASEREAITLTMLSKEISEDETYDIGEQLYDRTLENGNKWNIVSVMDTNQIYGNGWKYVPKKTTLENYGDTQYDWLVKEETGEILLLEEGNFTKLAYGENLAVKEGVILNVDPINMSDVNSWGNGVSLHGVQPGDGYGFNETEFKFDGVDDYIEVYTDVEMNEGITFEFYGKSTADIIFMLSKTIKGAQGWPERFRIQLLDSTVFRCCMSNKDSQSSWSLGGPSSHWIQKDDIGNIFKDGNAGYLTMTVDLKTDTISLYCNGEFLDSTVCNYDWLVTGYLTDGSVPFTIGFGIAGVEYTEYYANMDLYACRLYSQVLTKEEVKNNYNATVAYHNLLVQGK